MSESLSTTGCKDAVGLRAPLAAVAVSGALLGLTLPPLGLWPLAWLGLSPLLVASRMADSRRGAFLLGWAAGAAFFAVTMCWIYSTCRFAGVPIPVSLLAWLALVSFLALNWGAFSLLSREALGAGEEAWPWLCAVAWVALEFLSARFTPRVGGDLLGYTQWRFLAWLQPSSWLGPHALGFLIVLANGAFASWLVDRRCARPVPLNLKIAGGLGAAWLALGALMLATSAPPTGLMRKVAILQPNIDQYRKWDADEAASIRAVLDGLLARAAEAKPALIVWPETAVPGWLDEPSNLEWVSGWARRTGAYHLVGALLEEAPRRFNAAVLFDPAGRAVGRYAKRELVPFGEFVPFRSALEPWIGILAQMGDMDAGERRQRPLDTPIGAIGVSICYEAVFPRWSRSAASAGARVLVNITNDGWYKDTWGPLHHFHTNRFRAVENRTPVIRSGNTGISAVIDPWGREVASLGLLKPGVLVGELPGDDPFPRGSFYSRTGDWFGWLCVLAFAAAAALRLRAARR
ncbi:MAG: apolipoprotein N-acyltransferase [Elusimicrobia bacterium]|nr:apolipoprotein N-acyltransferase [Elusimicrobiota bacterium]